MVPLIVISALTFVPVLLALIFRVNALFIFVAVCAGYFLQFALSDDVDLAIATIIKGSNSLLITQFTLLLLPVLITLFVLRKSTGKGVLFQFIPLLLSGLFIGVLSLPLLPIGMEQAIYDSPYGANIKGAQDLIISAAVVSNLLLMWSVFKSHHTKSRHH